MQTQRQSIIETLSGTAVGLVIAIFAGQYLIYPAFGWHPDIGKNIWMTLAFTAVGIVRSYFWRRLFNWLGSR